MPCRSELLQIAETIRTSLEPGLGRDWDGAVVSQGACLHASLVLSYAINKWSLAQAEIRGGDGALDGGVIGADGAMYGHYWVEATTPNRQTYVLDITGDQFGYSRVVVETVEVAQARYTPGQQAVVDAAAVDLATSFGNAQLARFSAERLAVTNRACATENVC